MQIQPAVQDLEGFIEKQVVALKGLDISRQTTLVLPKIFSQGTESVVKALWDSNRQDSIFPKKKAENILM